MPECPDISKEDMDRMLTCNDKLYEQVKFEGNLVIDHYTFDISRLTKITSIILRPLIKRLSSKKRMNTIKFLVDIFFPLHRLIRNFPLFQKIFRILWLKN